MFTERHLALDGRSTLELLIWKNTKRKYIGPDLQAGSGETVAGQHQPAGSSISIVKEIIATAVP